MTDKTKSVTDTLRVLEGTEANLLKAERLWKELRQRMPDGIAFGDDPGYEEVRRRFGDVVAELPAIDGWKLEDPTMDLNAIAQLRLDAQEVDEIEVHVATAHAIEEPTRSLAEYRYRLGRKRRALIRTAVTGILVEIDGLLSGMTPPTEAQRREPASEHFLAALRRKIDEIDTLLGSSVARSARWDDLRRHLHFGLLGDVDDIRRLDWPAVKPSLESSLYGEDEAIPITVADLAEVTAASPDVAVPTALAWDRLSPDEFERLMFVLLSTDPAYEEVQLLMKAAAQDRGRDVSAYRISEDGLSGRRRDRVIAQCRHWPQRSIAVSDISTIREQMKLWEPPRVDVLIVATTGRFSQDSVRYIERHNQSDSALRIEMWPNSHLERVLAARPGLIGQFNLRR